MAVDSSSQVESQPWKEPVFPLKDVLHALFLDERLGGFEGRCCIEGWLY